MRAHPLFAAFIRAARRQRDLETQETPGEARIATVEA
jgi:hypothetical protein